VIASVIPLRFHSHSEQNVFINPMWQDEVQRIGKQRCTPTGYRLHGISDLIGFIAIILLLGVPCYLAYSAFRGAFTCSSLFLLLIPIGVAIAGNVLHSYSWHLADVRGFKYDYEKRTSTWRNCNGDLERFNYDDWRRQHADKSTSVDT
jgi:hypothetical protein